MSTGDGKGTSCKAKSLCHFEMRFGRLAGGSGAQPQVGTGQRCWSRGQRFRTKRGTQQPRTCAAPQKCGVRCATELQKGALKFGGPSFRGHDRAVEPDLERLLV